MYFSIRSSGGQLMGAYNGVSRADALAAMHRDAGYPRVRAEGEEVVFPDEDTAELCGGMSRWTVTPLVAVYCDVSSHEALERLYRTLDDARVSYCAGYGMPRAPGLPPVWGHGPDVIDGHARAYLALYPDDVSATMATLVEAGFASVRA